MNKLDFTISIPKHLVFSIDNKIVSAAQINQSDDIAISSILRMSINPSKGDLCDWLKGLCDRLIHRVKQIASLFGFSFSTTSTNTPVNILENKIVHAKQMLDEHFQNDFVVNANSTRSAIVVVMRYNGQYKVSFGSAQDMKNNTDATKAMLRELFTHELSTAVSNDDLFEVNTMVIEKTNSMSFNLLKITDSIDFRNIPFVSEEFG
jgi:hypothetical protein